jgi:deoxyribodipyrimidine photo-lyase
MSTPPAIVWFRQDLRLADNPALDVAANGGRPVVPVYVLDELVTDEWPMGGASRWWLDGSLRALSASLQERGSRLILRRGRTVDELTRLAAEIGAASIHFSRAYEPFSARLEQQLKSACDTAAVAVHRYCGSLLQEPEAIRTKMGEPFRVFTPYWRAVLAMRRRGLVAPPCVLANPHTWPASEQLNSWRLRPKNPDWMHGLSSTWTPGEAGAARRLEAVIDEALAAYAVDRDRPDKPGTSMLSPHLHFGEVSPVQCWHAVAMARDRNPALATGADVWLRELGWREFSYHLLHHWPHITNQPFRPEFSAFPWDTNAERSKKRRMAWQRGQTGYPIVDAGMRQLWQTGWMHNRVRMIVASFLTKHLLVPWQQGARWFWDTLVDADLASNSASWQWVAGSGADAAPYFRIFNPVLQGRKFDSDGNYVRRFVPELARLGADHIHAPWEAPDKALAMAGVRLGETYPRPIVDHAAARQVAMNAYTGMRGLT